MNDESRIVKGVLAAWRLGVSTLGVLAALGVTAATQAPLEFEVASIKVHPPPADGRFQSSMRTQPNGQVTMTYVSVRTLIGRAYPSRPDATTERPGAIRRIVTRRHCGAPEILRNVRWRHHHPFWSDDDARARQLADGTG